jgi:hypothetical protein
MRSNLLMAKSARTDRFVFDLWIKRYMEAGATLDEAMAVLGAWLNERRTFPVLSAVASGIAQFGNRTAYSLA